MKGGIIMKRFTKSTTFDVNYLFTDSREPSKKNYNKKTKFDNEAMFDVKNLFEK